jgi:hypothetical protein
MPLLRNKARKGPGAGARLGCPVRARLEAANVTPGRTCLSGGARPGAGIGGRFQRSEKRRTHPAKPQIKSAWR